MALPKIEEVRKLSDEEITEEIASVKKQLFELRLQRATGREFKPHQFKHARHRLGQLMTVERERQLSIARTPKQEAKDKE
jgi:large subunit ribosomal protein L29